MSHYTKQRAAKFSDPHDCGCEILIEGVCEWKACDAHHVKGRGLYLLVLGKLKRICRACHDFIDRNHAFAVENGYVESKLTNEQQENETGFE